MCLTPKQYIFPTVPNNPNMYTTDGMKVLDRPEYNIKNEQICKLNSIIKLSIINNTAVTDISSLRTLRYLKLLICRH